MEIHPGIRDDDFGPSSYRGRRMPAVGLQGGEDHDCTDCGKLLDGVHLLLKEGPRCVCFGCSGVPGDIDLVQTVKAHMPETVQGHLSPIPIPTSPRHMEPLKGIQPTRRARDLF